MTVLMQVNKIQYIFFLISFCFCIGHTDAQIAVTNNLTPEQMVQLIVGEGVQYSNVTYQGNAFMNGSFIDGSKIGIEKGLVLSSGDVTDIPSTNPAGNASTSYSVPGDVDLSEFTGDVTNDGSVLSFDFIPLGNTLNFQYVFASEEYPEFIDTTDFNDAFGFFLSGPGITGTYSSPAGFPNGSVNIALLPDLITPISIFNVNCNINSNLYVPNSTDNGDCDPPYTPVVTDNAFEYDGYTVVLTATYNVIPCTTYHIKLAVADARDKVLDSGVFLKKNSFSSNPISIIPVYSNPMVDTSMVEGCNNLLLAFVIDNVPSAPYSIPLTYGGTATFGVDYPVLPSSVVIPAGTQSTLVPVTPFTDGTEPTETFTVSFTVITCNGPEVKTYTYYIKDNSVLNAIGSSDVSVYCDQSVTISSSPEGGFGPFQYLWSNGGTTSAITVSPTATTDYIVHITDACGSVASDTITATVLPTMVNAGPDRTTCAAVPVAISGEALNYLAGSQHWEHTGSGVLSGENTLTPTYTPGAGESGIIKIKLSVNGLGGCEGQTISDSLFLQIDPMPETYAGTDGTFCVLNPIDISGAWATHYSNLQWSGGDGHFSSINILDPNYMPGNNDFNSGNVTLTLRAFGQLTCSEQSVADSLDFNVTPYPLVSAGPDDYICSNITQYTLAGTGKNYNIGAIQWSFSGGDGFFSDPTILNPVYYAGPIDLSTFDRNIVFTLTLHGVGNCSDVTVVDQMLLKIDPTPESDAGPDDETCGRLPYQLNATGLFENTINWLSSGSGEFSNPNIVNPTYKPSIVDVGTTVILTLDLSGCRSLTNADFMKLTVHPDPSASISGTADICEGSSTQISIALTGTPPWNLIYTDGITPVTVTTNTSPYQFTVSPNSSTSWWITSANDKYCDALSDSIQGFVMVSVNPLPETFVVTASNDGFYCEGDTGVLIGVNNSQTGMDYELLFNGLSTGKVLNGTGFTLEFGIFSAIGQYEVRGINPIGNCTKMMDDTVTVIMTPTPVMDFNTNTSCYG
ncbi:MAG: choice-of-anchor L domain-containing protein, partial [Bacteroidales bacterium]